MIMRLQDSEKIYCCTFAVLTIAAFLFILPAVIASNPIESLRAPTSGRSNPISAGFLSITPENIQSNIFSGEDEYDARDEFNQPVKTKTAQKKLQALFIGSIYELLAKAQVFSIAKAQEFLNKVVNPSALAFARAAWRSTRVAVSAVISQFKRQSILILLPFILIALTAISSLHFSFLIFTPKSRVAPLVLRC